MKLIFFIILSLSMLKAGVAQSIVPLDKDGLTEILNKSNDTVYVLNFWATWCSPCVSEIAYFEELHHSFINQKVKVILVNLDFPNQLEKRVIPFVEDKGITADVANMTDLDYNSWISSVDESWSGALPATKIFKADNSLFLGRELSKSELFKEVNKFLILK